MTINVPNPIAEMRKATGYTITQVSIVSGLTEFEITRLDTGKLKDGPKLTRLLAAIGAKKA